MDMLKCARCGEPKKLTEPMCSTCMFMEEEPKPVRRYKHNISITSDEVSMLETNVQQYQTSGT